MGENLSDKEKFHIQVLLEEYRALRGEIIQSMQNRNSILTFGSAILGASISGTALSAKSLNELAILMICIMAIPLLSLCTFNFWIAETTRIVRAAVYIKEHIETKVNTYMDNTFLWESYIRVPCDKKCPVKIDPRQFKVDDAEQVFYLFAGITSLSFLAAIAYIMAGSNASMDLKKLLYVVTLIGGLIFFILFRNAYIVKLKVIIRNLRYHG